MQNVLSSHAGLTKPACATGANDACQAKRASVAWPGNRAREEVSRFVDLGISGLGSLVRSIVCKDLAHPSRSAPANCVRREAHLVRKSRA